MNERVSPLSGASGKVDLLGVTLNFRAVGLEGVDTVTAVVVVAGGCPFREQDVIACPAEHAVIATAASKSIVASIADQRIRVVVAREKVVVGRTCNIFDRGKGVALGIAAQSQTSEEIHCYA